MMNNAFKLTAGGMMLVMSVTVWSTSAIVGPAVAATVGTSRSADAAADRAGAALRANKPFVAVRLAEKAVAKAPRDARLRALLGQAYLAAGRFASAETSYQEALVLDPSNGRATLNLALAQIALGKAYDARQTLESARGKVGDSDFGLALALAGDREGAIPVLEGAARAYNADAKARQNLALTYALSGRWAEARTTAAQDVAPADVDARMTAWAELANPKGASDQIATLLNVNPVNDDRGRPVALALAPTVAPFQQAAAEPAAPAAELAVVEPQVEAAVAAPEIAVVAEDPVAERAEVVAEVVAKPMYVAPQPVALAPAPLVRPVAAMESRHAQLIRAAMPTKSSRPSAYVVQLGAYSSDARLQAAWKQASKKAGYLSAFSPVTTTYRTSLHRLAVSGFASRSEAAAVCRKVQAAGIGCFPRATAGDVPVRWASGENSTRLASR